MLLSKENLLLLSNESKQENVKLDRILLYIQDQKAYCSYYKSPNHSVTQSTSSPVSAASVSYKHPTVNSSHLEEYNALPHTKNNGFHLLQKFSSPNLEINRITLKQNRPKLGLFNKGKSSAQATKTVPDLVFSEAEFLKKRKQDSHSHDTLIQKKKHKSKFFQQKSQVSKHGVCKSTLSFHPPSPLLNKQTNSKSSNQTIKRILKECRDAPQVVLDYYSQQNSLDNYYYETSQSDSKKKQVPTYAPVKTPIRSIESIAIITDSSHRETISQLDLSNNKNSPDDLDQALDLFYKTHHIIQPNKPNPCDDDNLVDWQIESLTGSVEETKEEYSNDILNFWEYQYKRTL